MERGGRALYTFPPPHLPLYFLRFKGSGSIAASSLGYMLGVKRGLVSTVAPFSQNEERVRGAHPYRFALPLSIWPMTGKGYTLKRPTSTTLQPPVFLSKTTRLQLAFLWVLSDLGPKCATIYSYVSCTRTRAGKLPIFTFVSPKRI